MTFAALTNETIGWTIFIVILIGVVTYTVINILRGAKAELGSEIELAPNRKPYLDDEGLEGPKLTKALTWGLVLMGVTAVGLPAYWLREPTRQAGGGFNRGTAWFEHNAIEHGYAEFRLNLFVQADHASTA